MLLRRPHAPFLGRRPMAAALALGPAARRPARRSRPLAATPRRRLARTRLQPDRPVRGGARPRQRPHRVQGRRSGDRAVPAAARRSRGRSTGRAPRALPAGSSVGQGAARRPERAESGHARAAAPRVDAPDRRSGHGHRGRPAPRVVRAARPTVELAAAVDPGRPPPRGVRLPAVLGADRQLDHARLGEDLDRRLLRRRGRRQGQPHQEEQRRVDDRRLERLDQLEDDERHQRRARQPHAGRADRAELRLDGDRPRPPEGAARQRRPPGQPRPPDRGRPSATAAPTASTSTSSRSPRATPTSSPRSSARSARRSNAVAKGYQLTFDTTGWIGNYPIEDATATGGADAIFVMGYDYRRPRRARSGRSRRSADRPTTSADTVKAYVGAHPRLEGHPRRAVLRPRLVDGEQRRCTRRTSRARSTARRSRCRTRPRASSAPTTARRYDAGEGVAWTAYRRENCTPTYGCVKPWRQLYFDDATALKAKYDLVNQYGLRGAGIWALGYDGTRPELYAAIKAKFITDTVPPTIKSGSISATLVSPNGDGRLESTTAPTDRDRPGLVGVPRPAVERLDGSGRPCGPGARPARPRRSRGTGGTRAARWSPTADTVSRSGRPMPRATAPNAGSPCASIGPQPRSRPRRRAATSRPTAMATTTRCRCRGRPREALTGVVRLRERGGDVGPGLVVLETDELGDGLDRARPGRASSCLPAGTRSRSRAATGPAT